MTGLMVITAVVTDEHEKDIDEAKEEQMDLDAKIREWENKIKQQHKNMGGVHMSSQHTTQTQKTVRVLENRLDQVQSTLSRLHPHHHPNPQPLPQPHFLCAPCC